MHDNSFVELMKIKAISIHAIRIAYNGLEVDVSTTQFKRPTRQWVYFTYEQWHEFYKKGWY